MGIIFRQKPSLMVRLGQTSTPLQEASQRQGYNFDKLSIQYFNGALAQK